MYRSRSCMSRESHKFVIAGVDAAFLLAHELQIHHRRRVQRNV